MHREIIINPTYEAWRKSIERIPQGDYTSLQTYCCSRNIVERVNLNSLEVVVKRYHRPNLLNKVVYSLFRLPKAVRSYKVAAKLAEQGIDTPDAVAVITTREGIFFTDSWYVSIYNPAPPVGETITEEDRTRLDTLFDHNKMLRDFREFAISLFERGIYQRDFNRGNFLAVAGKNGNYSFSMVDINRVHFLERPLTPAQIAMSWVRFGADLTPGIVEMLTVEAGQRLGYDKNKCRRAAARAVKRGFRIERRRQIKRRWRNRHHH